ncbi:MAG: glycerol kinase, partial [Lachnospiraceae bacterium]|nr:glycerol kinase [Lachnospiraceae bacterium]
TKNRYLMQFQSDIADCDVCISKVEELSGTGAAFMAGMELGLWQGEIFDTIKWDKVFPEMEADVRRQKYDGYTNAVDRIKTR